MTPEDDPIEPTDPRRRKARSPFDEFFQGMGFGPGEFDKVFAEMQRAMAEAMKNLGGVEPGKPYVHGFSFKIGPDGKPQVTEFGNKPQRPQKGARPVLSDEREPLTDLIDEANQIAVTVELPGVNKKDIDIRVTEDELEIHVENEKRKYYKLLNLPARVKPPTTKATYNNGVLDITIQKQPSKASEKGFKVSVD